MGVTCNFRWDEGALILHGPTTEKLLSDKYADFFCLLIVADAGVLVDRDMVAQCSSWSANQTVSAGKQIARFLDQLANMGCHPVIALQKTYAWRLAEHVHAAIDGTTRARAKDRLSASRQHLHHKTDIPALLRWYRVNFQALVDMTTGKAETGYALLRNCMTATSKDEYWSISNVLATRIEQRMADQRLPVMPSIKSLSAPLARAIEIRRNAAYAIYSESGEWPQLEAVFRRELASMAHSGDFTTIAILQNALGVLQRRQGKFETALEHMKEAAPLAIFSGDLILIQNVAFNLANICSEIHRQNPSAILPDQYIDLLKYDVILRDTMALGRDSAQTELLLSYLLYEAGDDTQARHYLDMANTIITETQVEVDQALSHRICGLLEARAGNIVAAVEQLTMAQQIYSGAGYNAAAKHVSGEIADIS